ncbi:hypothetical protein MAR_005141, partial [Mya arenaria]
MSSQSTSIEVCDKNFTDKRIQEHTTADGSMAASFLQGDSLVEAKSMSESLLKAKESVYPVSRLDMITKLKGMKKQRDAKLDKRARRVYMVTNYVMPFFKQRVNETVAFAKLIPGFSDLHINDQKSLIKDSIFECSSISGHTYDSSSGIFYADDGTPLDTTDLELVMGFQEIVIKRLEFSLYVESLTMTPLEES